MGEDGVIAKYLPIPRAGGKVYNCHEVDLVFGSGLPHKINNFDETWVENAQPRILISYKFI